MRPMEPKYSRHEIGPNMDIIVLTDDGPDAPDETGLIQFEPVQNNPIQILFLFIVNILSNQKTFDYHQALVPIILQARDIRTIFRPPEWTVLVSTVQVSRSRHSTAVKISQLFHF